MSAVKPLRGGSPPLLYLFPPNIIDSATFTSVLSFPPSITKSDVILFHGPSFVLIIALPTTPPPHGTSIYIFLFKFKHPTNEKRERAVTPTSELLMGLSLFIHSYLFSGFF